MDVSRPWGTFSPSLPPWSSPVTLDGGAGSWSWSAALWAHLGCCLKLIPLGFQMLFCGRHEEGAVVDMGSPSPTLRCPFCPSSDAQFLQAAGRTASWGAGLWFLHRESISSITSPGGQAGFPCFSLSVGLAGFPGGHSQWHPPANAGVAGLTPGSGRAPGGGHGNPLQYSCLENSTDRGAWHATVHRVAQSLTQPKWLSFTHVGLASQTGGSGCPLPS